MEGVVLQTLWVRHDAESQKSFAVQSAAVILLEWASIALRNLFGVGRDYRP